MTSLDIPILRNWTLMVKGTGKPKINHTIPSDYRCKALPSGVGIHIATQVMQESYNGKIDAKSPYKYHNVFQIFIKAIRQITKTFADPKLAIAGEHICYEIISTDNKMFLMPICFQRANPRKNTQTQDPIPDYLKGSGFSLDGKRENPNGNKHLKNFEEALTEYNENVLKNKEIGLKHKCALVF